MVGGISLSILSDASSCKLHVWARWRNCLSVAYYINLPPRFFVFIVYEFPIDVHRFGFRYRRFIITVLAYAQIFWGAPACYEFLRLNLHFYLYIIIYF